MEYFVTITVEPIKAYSFEHLITGLGLIVLAAVFVFILRKMKKTVVITAIGILLIILEVAKQVLMHQIYTGYSWSDIPFQLCSIPMYLCVTYPLINRGRSAVENFLKSFGLLGAIVAFAIPYDVFSPQLMMAIQSIVWHELLLILGIYCIATAEKGKRIGVKDLANNALLYLALAVVAICINALLMKISAGTANMFFLGPSKPYVLILEDIYERCGWLVESIVMICVSEMAAALLLIIGDRLTVLFEMVKEKLINARNKS